MAQIDNIVQVTITRQTSQVDIEAFDIPLLMVEMDDSDVSFTDRVRTYTSLEAVADDFTIQHKAYQMAEALLSGQNRPATFKIGKVNKQAGEVETYAEALQAILDFDSSWYAVITQSHADEDIMEVAETIQAMRKTYFTSTASGLALQQSQTVVYTAGVTFNVTGVLEDDTLTINIGGEKLTSTYSVADGWSAWVSNLPSPVFGGTISEPTAAGVVTITWDSNFVVSKASQVLAAGYTGDVPSEDIQATDPLGMDIGQRLQYRGFDRTVIIYSVTADAEYPEAVWVGSQLVETPGSNTWEYKQLPSVSVSTLTDSQVTLVESRGYNYYINVKGVNITRRGKVAEGEWIDTIILVDWLYARLQEAVFNRLVNSRKIPFTEAGAAIIENEIRSVLNQQVEIGGIDTFSVTAPRVLAIPQTQRAARIMGDFTFSARLAGAVSIVVIRGVVEY